MPRLYVLSGALLGRVFEFEGDAVLGRIPAADVTLDDGSVSRRHARVVTEGGRWRVEDLGSSNGTFVDGERVDSAPLAEGEVFRVGAVELRFREGSGEGSGGAEVRSEPLPPDPSAGGPDSGPDSGPDPDDRGSNDGDADDGLELEFGEDLDEALQEAPRPAATPPREGAGIPAPARAPGPGPGGRADARPGSKGARSKAAGPHRAAGRHEAAGPQGGGASAAASRDARRRAALGGAAPRPTVSDGDGGRPVLQYAKTRSGGTDVSQFGWFGRLVVALLGLGIFGGALWAAFWLTQGGD